MKLQESSFSILEKAIVLNIYLLASYVGILDKSQGRLEAFQLSHRIRLSHKLLDESQVFAPLWTLFIVNPLVQAQSLLVAT